jgi:glutathione S-transferase
MESASTLVLRGGPISPFVRKVGICLLEKGLEPVVARVRSPTAMVKPNQELQHFNPLSKIPTLILPQGTALFDSDVINEYLDTTYPPAILHAPAGPMRWEQRRWCALGSGLLDALVLWRNERNRPLAGQSAEILTAFEIKVQASLRRLEAEVGDLGRAAFAIGHVAIGCVFGYLDFRFPDIGWRASFPGCRVWFDELAQRPSIRRTVPYEGSPPAASEPHLWPAA